MRPLLFLALFCSLTNAALADDPAWKAGAAKVVITPERPMWMSGYGGRNKPAEGKASELYAKALVLEDEAKQRVVLVTLDLIGIDREMSQNLFKAINAKHGVPRERVMFACSHTHCGPVVGKNLNSMFFFDAVQAKLVDDYAERLPGLATSAVDQAVKNFSPARVEVGKGQCGFAVNRRHNKESEATRLREAGRLKGPFDHDVPVLCVRDASDRLQAVVFGYACHATTLDFYQWSADWPGYAQAEIESAHPGAVAMFWAGCGADQNPLPRRSLTLAWEYGKELAQSVEEIVKAPMTSVKPSLRAKFIEVDLPLAELPSREKLVEETMDKNKFVVARAKMLLAELEKSKSLRQTYPYPIQAWQLGDDLTWLALGGEVVVDYSLRLKKELGPIWTTAYANDVMAYIPSLRVLKEGGYEGATSMIYYGMPTVWSPRVEERIVEAATKLVSGVRSVNK